MPAADAWDPGRARVAAGAGWSDVSGLVGTEATIGVVYLVFGMLMLTYFERESRRTASLERV